MTYRLPLLCLSLFLFTFHGCGGPAKPADFPKLVRPVTVKIHKGGEPLSGVSVSLHSKDIGSGLAFSISGRTGANGMATIQTSRNTYSKPGAPVGTFIVQLSETVEVDMSDWKWQGTPQQNLSDDTQIFRGITPQELDAQTKEFDKRADAARKIPKILTGAESPLELDISAAPVTAEFDVSKY